MVINLRAGTALGLTQAEIEHTVTEAFSRAGHAVSVFCVLPEEVEAAVARAATSDIDVLVVGGGDGTVRTGARHVMGTDKALGILPLGTMNRMAKDLEIPHSLGAAVAFLSNAKPSKVDVGTVNGSIFLCNSIMGATLSFSVGRARLRGRPARERLPRYFLILREILSSRRKLSIVVDNGEDRLRIRALSVAVTNNGYDETMSWFRRSRLANGTLTMYVSKHRSGFGLALALGRALIGRWHGDPEMVKLTGSEFAIYSRKRSKWLANDGELLKFDTPLRYAIVPRALKVLMKHGS
ncbi:diacylglycerol kinase family protein [Hyphomicrobium sp. CS1GBMeth3]|uniref:diacylglycerol/lipid kinase family protein n=1 Tax=Hyphomicrobium sp. CS1GBMeth3 TaxID=1892845 RepID=UPI000931699A|nr:diacylglycerol kinase family protein [Hyphomicrobium sp. CS1GBMeth3]